MSTPDSGICLTPSEYSATVQRVEKLNARAVAKGFTGRLAVSGEAGGLQQPGRPAAVPEPAAW